MMMPNNNMFMEFGSIIATLMFLRAMYNQYLPYQLRETIDTYTYRYANKLANIFSPYLHIVFEEHTGDRFKRNEVYTTIKTYLSESSSMKARRMKANPINDGKSLVLGIADNEEVTDEYKGAIVWWSSIAKASRSQTITFYPGTDENRSYKLTFYRGHRKLITDSYLNYVIKEGNAIAIRKRQRRLYTNIKDPNFYSYKSKSLWSHIEFKHPARFETIAMVPTKKQAILDELIWFAQSKDYYAKVGKPWKRGYLLYGPPGTGKSTMIAAMANFMDYDIYDLELTAVKDNTHLKRLLIETTNKSIIVIEDIDCSLDLTGQRKTKKKEKDEDKDKKEDEVTKKKLKELEEKKSSEVTLSGLLNFIDGIWSACGEERLIVFTTNYIEKLDPALIRRGRMDMHIELSYCCFDAFKMLAKNYLDIDSHCLFDRVRELLEETNVAPVDVAENLMPRKVNLDVDACMEGLVKALEKAKADERLKEEEEKRSKEEKESKESKKSSDEDKKDS